jgi:hypothetical protein
MSVPSYSSSALLGKSNDTDFYFRRLPVQFSIGSYLKLTMLLGPPQTFLSVILACNATYYDFQLDMDFENDTVVLGAQQGLNQTSKNLALPNVIKSLVTKEFSLTVKATKSTFIVCVMDNAKNGVWTEYSHPFSLCKAEYVLLHASQSIHSVKFSGLPLMPLRKSDGLTVASILSSSYVQSAKAPSNNGEIVCPLVVPSNGFATVSGSVSVYGCNHNFMLVGNVMRHCQQNGLWTGDQPVCKAQTCGMILTSPPNGYVVEVYSGYAAYQCVAGFELWGNPVRECLEIGQWADVDVYCYVHPKIVGESSDHEFNITALLKQPIDFSCTAVGFPVPKIVWLRNGKPIFPNNRVQVKVNRVTSRLVIKYITSSDRGNYTCLASNLLGEDSETFLLIDST